MARVINGLPSRSAIRARPGIPSTQRAARALHRVAFAALSALLGTFVAVYPLLRLGHLGPVPEGQAVEIAFGLAAGFLATVVLLLEGRG